jgi:hypothetical protein
MTWWYRVGGALALLLLMPVDATTAIDARIKCQADKNKHAGKYVACRLKVVAEGLRSAEVPDFSKCEARFVEAWARAEERAAGSCPTQGDVGTLKRDLEKCTTEASTAIETFPGTPPPRCLTGGFLVGGHCWFVTNPGDSCDYLCVALGLIYDGATESFSGSGGSLANCQKLVNGYFATIQPNGLTSLGAIDHPCADFDLGGLGCTALTVGFAAVPVRCTTPPTMSTAAHDAARRFCACMTP